MAGTRLRINGKDVEFARPTPLVDYLAGLGVDPRAVAVEVDGEILPREQLKSHVLQGGQVVEIVRMVGGGRVTGFQA
jgi:sulfur carrier protein